MILYGINDAKLRKSFDAVMERLKSNHFIVSEEKFASFTKTFSFLGQEMSSDGNRPEPKHTDKLLQLQSTTNVKKVEAFHGLINYFDRTIPNFAAKTRCINELRQKYKVLQWTNECQRSFQSLIDQLTTKSLFEPYSLEQEVSLTTDAPKKTNRGSLDNEWSSRNLDFPETNKTRTQI